MKHITHSIETVPNLGDIFSIVKISELESKEIRNIEVFKEIKKPVDILGVLELKPGIIFEHRLVGRKNDVGELGEMNTVANVAN